MEWCRKCRTELGWFNTGKAGDLCKACQGEKDEERSHRLEVEVAMYAQASAARAAEAEIEDRRKLAKEQAAIEKKQQQIDIVHNIIAAADTIDEETEAVPADRGVQLDFLAKLANLFPATWDVWLFADSLVPHRVEVAYARHRTCVVPLLEAVLEARDEFPTSPARLLRTLATSFLLKDFDVIRRIQRDLPARLEPIRQKAREAMARIKEMQATKWKLEQERKELGFFSAMRGRTKAVVESEIEALDGDIVKEKQVVARLEEEAKQAKRAFELSCGDPALRSILSTIDGKTEIPNDDFLLLEETPPAASPLPVPFAPKQIDLTPEQSELIRLLRDMLAMKPSDIFSAWQFPKVAHGTKGRYRLAKDEAVAVGKLASMSLVRKLLNPAQELSNLLRQSEATDGSLPERHVRAVTSLIREAKTGLDSRPAPFMAKVLTGAGLGGLLLLSLGLAFTSGGVAFVGLLTILGGVAGAVWYWMPWFVRRKLCRDIQHYLSPFLVITKPGGVAEPRSDEADFTR